MLFDFIAGQQGNDPNFTIDDAVVQQRVSEPSTLALLAAGVLILASTRVSVLLLRLGLFWMDAAEAQAASDDKPVFTLSVRVGRLSAGINRIPLRVVFEELARQATAIGGHFHSHRRKS